MTPLHSNVQFLATLSDGRLSAGFGLVVAVSGGPDSLALLHALAITLPPERLFVAHVNHGLRTGAAADAAFVEAAATERKLPLYATTIDVAARARSTGVSLEAAGRIARYAFLADVADEVGATAVAVGHNADDQVETVLMHLLRGSGLSGLRGMQAVSGVPGRPDLSLLRPFLTVPRQTIEAYCLAHELNPRLDPTNQDLTFFRNAIRHQLLPHLEAHSPQFRTRLQQLAIVVAGDEELLDQVAAAAWENVLVAQSQAGITLNRAAWRTLPLSMKRRVLRHAVTQLTPGRDAASFAAIEQARRVADQGATGGESMLPGGLSLRVDYEVIQLGFYPPDVLSNGPQLSASMALPVPGTLFLPENWILSAEVLADPDLVAVLENAEPWQAFVDIGERSALQVRFCLTGERLQPLGMGNHSAKISAIMSNRKISPRLRSRWPVVADESRPIWLVGHVVDERARVTPLSRRVVRLTCTPRERAAQPLLIIARHDEN